MYKCERETKRNQIYLRRAYAVTYAAQVSLTRGHVRKLAGADSGTYAAPTLTYAAIFWNDASSLICLAFQ